MSQHSRLGAIARLITLTSILGLVACSDKNSTGRLGPGGSSGGASGTGGVAGIGVMVDADSGAGGGGGTGGGGADVDAGTDSAASSNGVPCIGADQCSSGYCVDGVCCDQPCGAVCYTCTAPGSFGICVAAATGTDPRDECDNQGAASCGTSGKCNGAGACSFYAGNACGSTTPACNAASSAIVQSSVCDGMGSCAPDVVHDCNGYRCQNAACGTGPCTSDAVCAPHAFCSASACVASPSNLAGNGDVEYGDTTGWFGFAGVGTFALSSTATGGFSNTGMSSVVAGGRTQLYQGPAYGLPTGPGRYTISVWAMQQDDPSITGLVQIQVNCNTTTQYVTVQSGGFGMSLTMGVWAKFSATVDTSTLPDDCLAAATPPGVIKTALVYLNQSAAGAPVELPDLYLDDLVVQVPDDHNLIGNPNCETGAVDGWTVANDGTLAVSTAVPANGGMNSLAVTARPSSTSGPRYALPLGPARYNITFHVLHNGSTAHDLILQPSYTCLGGSQVFPPPIATEPAVPANTWTTLSGTVVLPPVGAAAGCKLVQADVHVEQEEGACATIECPDLFLDDAAITLAP